MTTNTLFAAPARRWGFVFLLYTVSVLLFFAPRPEAAQPITGGTSSGTFITLQSVYPGQDAFILFMGQTISADASGVTGNDSQNWVFENNGTINAGLNGGTGSGIALGSLVEGVARVVNSGTITSATNKSNGPSGVRFTNGGQVINLAGGSISGFDGVHADGGILVVDNSGTIEGKSMGSAVYLGEGGEITNRAGALIGGTGYGIDSNAVAGNVVISNHGNIITNDQAINLDQGNVYAILNDAGAVIQSGGGATVDIAGATGYLLNKGTITAGNIGIRANNTQGQNIFVNTGTIVANGGPAIQTGTDDSDTIIYNLGTVQTNGAGGDAILIQGSNTRLVLAKNITLPALGPISGPGSTLVGNARSTGTNNDIVLYDDGSEDARKLIGFRNLSMDGTSWTLANSLVLSGGLHVENGDLALTGDNTFGGGVSKSGTGTLTLSGVNAYPGPTLLNGGTLALVGAGALAGTSKLAMAVGTRFDFSGMTAASISLPRLEILGRNTALDAGGGAKTLVLSGGRLIFNLAGAAAGDTMLSADNGLVISSSTRVVLLHPPALTAIGERVTLADNLADPPASSFTDRFTLVGFKKYFLGLAGDDLVVELLGASSYRLEDELFFDPLRLNNVNLRNGSDYLDRLAALTASGSFDPEFMSLLDYGFSSSLALGGPSAARSLEQVFGGYAAYADTALRLTSNRFADLWRGRNRLFVDRLSLRRARNGTPAASAIGSTTAFASPIRCLREEDPAEGSGFWADGFGAWADQDGAQNLSGYGYDSRGAALGYEFSPNHRLRLGVAAAYSRGTLRVGDLKWRNKPDILNLAVYSVYAHESGVYAQGGLSYGRSWNKYEVDMLLGGRKSGTWVFTLLTHPQWVVLGHG